MKTKPFDLEAALNGAKLVTRDGHRVSNFRNRGELVVYENEYPYVGVVDLLGHEYHETFTKEGRASVYSSRAPNDLFLVEDSEDEPVETPTAEQANPLEEKVHHLEIQVQQMTEQIRKLGEQTLRIAELLRDSLEREAKRKLLTPTQHTG